METKQKFTDQFKRKVIAEVLHGELTKEEARRKYGLKGKSAVLNWMRKLGVSSDVNATTYFTSMEADAEQTEQLNKRIKELEIALEDAQLKAEAYSKMIDIAEQKLNIRIRKKSSTKQSSK